MSLRIETIGQHLPDTSNRESALALAEAGHELPQADRTVPTVIEWKPDDSRPEDPTYKIDAQMTDPKFADPGVTPVVLLLGYGEDQRAGREAVNVTSAMTGGPAIAPYLKYDQSNDDTKLDKSVTETVVATIKHINEQLGRKPEAPVDVVVHSQGGAVIMKAVNELKDREGYEDTIRALAMISPAGMTNEKMGQSLIARKLRFIGRFAIWNNLHADQLPIDLPHGWGREGAKGYSDNRKAAAAVVSLAADDGLRLWTKLGIAFRQSGPTAVKNIRERLADGKPTAIFAGTKDIFPIKDYEEVLSETVDKPGGVLESIPKASHSAVGTPAGDAQLEDALYWLIDERESLQKQAA